MKKKGVIYLMSVALLSSLPMSAYASESGGGTEYFVENAEVSEEITEDMIMEDDPAEDIIPEGPIPSDTEEPDQEMSEPEEQLPDKIVEETVPMEFQDEIIQEIAEDFLFDDVVSEDELLLTSESGVEGFVSRMYTVALNREAEKAGFDDWVNRLQSGETDGAAVAQGFILSDEFTERKLNDSDYVDVLYRTFFDREADSEGKKKWMDKLD